MSYIRVKTNQKDLAKKIFDANPFEAYTELQRRGFDVERVEAVGFDSALYFTDKYSELSNKQLVEYVCSKHGKDKKAILKELGGEVLTLVDYMAIHGKGLIEDVNGINPLVKQRQIELGLV